MAKVWRKGEDWRVVSSLNRLNDQIRAAYPHAVPPATPATSWGSIADSAHSSNSDHYPHYYTALGRTAVVCARDFPHAPALGLNAHIIAENLRLSRDRRINYIISNGRITGPSHNWQWDDYNGNDPHDTHIHVSVVHGAAADNPNDWQIGEWDVMATRDQIREVVEEVVTDVLFGSKWKEYYDQDKDGTRDPRALPDMIFDIHRTTHEIKDALIEEPETPEGIAK